MESEKGVSNHPCDDGGVGQPCGVLSQLRGALSQLENNKPVADFYCGHCLEEYELKSKHGEAGKRILDGAYTTIPKYFFAPSMIEKRKALAISPQQ